MAAVRFWFYPKHHAAREIWTRCLSAGVRVLGDLKVWNPIHFRRELLYNAWRCRSFVMKTAQDFMRWTLTYGLTVTCGGFFVVHLQIWKLQHCTGIVSVPNLPPTGNLKWRLRIGKIIFLIFPCVLFGSYFDLPQKHGCLTTSSIVSYRISYHAQKTTGVPGRNTLILRPVGERKLIGPPSSPGKCWAHLRGW